MMTIGITVTSALGIQNAVAWGTITILCMIPPVCTIIIMFFMPESPFYLVSKNKDTDALKSLVWLRGNTNEVDSELEQLKKSSREQKESPDFSCIRLLTEGVYFKPFIISLMLMFSQQFSGIAVITQYMKPIFLQAGSTLDAGLSSFIVNLVQVFMTGLAAISVDKLGRKPLLLMSGLGCSLSVICVGVFFYLDENKKCLYDRDIQSPIIFNQSITYTPDDVICVQDSNIDPEIVKSITWLPLVSLTVFSISFALGLGPLPWVLMAELFPQEAKDKASSLVCLFQWLMAFVTLKFTNNLNDAINVSGGYFFFGSVCFLSIAFIIYFAPETKGKTNDQMKEMFMTTRQIHKNIAQIGGAVNNGFSV